MLQNHWYLLASLFFALALAFSATGRAASSEQPSRRLSLETAVDALIDRNLTVMAARYNVDLFRAQRVAAALKPNPTIVFSANQFSIPRVISQPRFFGVTNTDAAAGIGLLPAAISTGIGSETQQPLARVVVGSMVTAPMLTLLVLPALCLIVHRMAEARTSRSVAETLPGQALAEE